MERVVASRWGAALLSPSLPRIWSLNLFWVDRLPRRDPAGALAEEADRLLGGAGLPHRRLDCPDPVAGERLAGGLAALGYEAHFDVVMARPVDTAEPPPADRARVVDPEELRDAYAEAAREEPDGQDADVAAQLVAMRAGWPALHVAAFDDGDPVSFCLLHLHEGTAEIDDVTTLERARRRGHARDLMAAALSVAAERGCDLAFLRADPEDWPKEFYRRLGFRTVGREHAFLRRG